MKEGYSPSGSSNVTVYEDPYTGEILGKTNPNAPMAFYSVWKRGLHFATWGGEPVKIASFFMGMMPLFLMITGLVIWQFKARARRRSKSSSRVNEIPPKAMVPTMSSANKTYRNTPGKASHKSEVCLGCLLRFFMYSSKLFMHLF